MQLYSKIVQLYDKSKQIFSMVGLNGWRQNDNEVAMSSIACYLIQ
jgi:hypothetical protein